LTANLFCKKLLPFLESDNLFCECNERRMLMKVRDLVAALLNYNQDLPVVVANFEFGFDDLVQIEIIETVVADHGDAAFVLADGQPASEKQTVLCLGPVEPSASSTPEEEEAV
jgi:hypothetical protein